MNHDLYFQEWSIREKYGKVDSYSRILFRMQAMGYAGVELVLDLKNTPPPALRGQIIRNMGLSVSSCHISLSAAENEPDRVIDSLGHLDTNRAVVAYLYPDSINTVSACERTADRLNTVVQRFKTAGIATSLHNHWDEGKYITAAGTYPLEILFKMAKDLLWQMDTAWWIFAGHELIPWMLAFQDRISSLHIKDLTSHSDATAPMPVLGKGYVPVADILAHVDPKWTVIIERDYPPEKIDVYEALRMDYAYARASVKCQAIAD